jgi:hypothetical protein
MISEFYLIDKSFKYPEGLSKEVLEERIKNLANDYEYIRQYTTEKVFVHDSIYDEMIYPEITVMDFLSYSSKAKTIFNKQIVTYLNILIRKSKPTKIDTSEVVDVLLSENNQDRVHGLMCLHEIKGISKEFLIFNKNNWLDFHRHYLGLYPHSPIFFISECIKYFPAICFHENNINTVRKILMNSSKVIVHYLSELNDKLPNCIDSTKNRIELLKQFNSIASFDMDSSIEGDSERKKRLCFYFLNSKGAEESVCCEPHLKMLYNDFKKKEQNRIYFHEGKSTIQNGKILVGHIGAHINFK